MVAETALVRENNVDQTNSNTSGHRSTTTTARDDDDDRTPYVHRKKIFAKDEGEYVDYEEVK